MIYPTDVEVSKMTLNHSYNNKKKSIKNSFTHLLQNQLDWFGWYSMDAYEHDATIHLCPIGLEWI